MRIPAVLLLLPIAACARPEGGALPSPSFLEVRDLFVAGQGGYASYRIPAVAVTRRGVVVVAAEARRHDAKDWGSIDLVLRRSPDGGKTWEPMRKLMEAPADLEQNPVSGKRRPGDLTMNNPVLVADRAGTLHVLVCGEYRRCWVLRSRDDGASFSAPEELTSVFEEFRRDYDWKVIATGPGHGIQLANGRIVVPVWLSTGAAGGHRPSVTATIVSDDAGRTWRRGAIAAAPPGLSNPSEAAVAELPDGGVMINVRHESEPRFRAVSRSPDGRSAWSPPELDRGLPDTVCMASLLRLNLPGAGRKGRLLFCSPHNPGGRERKNLTLKLSYDEGRTWPVSRVIEPGPAAYSDLALGPDHTLYCFFEKGTSLSLARFNLEWASGEQDRLEADKSP